MYDPKPPAPGEGPVLVPVFHPPVGLKSLLAVRPLEELAVEVAVGRELDAHWELAEVLVVEVREKSEAADDTEPDDDL